MKSPTKLIPEGVKPGNILFCQIEAENNMHDQWTKWINEAPLEKLGWDLCCLSKDESRKYAKAIRKLLKGEVTND